MKKREMKVEEGKGLRGWGELEGMKRKGKLLEVGEGKGLDV